MATVTLWFRSKMAAMLVQVTLLMMTVIHLTSSQPADECTCASNEQKLNGLLATVLPLSTSIGELSVSLDQLKRDVLQLLRESQETGNLCYSEYNFNLNFNFYLI